MNTKHLLLTLLLALMMPLAAKAQTIYQENFDSYSVGTSMVTPTGWTITSSGSGVNASVFNANYYSAPNCFLMGNPQQLSANRILAATLPTLDLNVHYTKLTFRVRSSSASMGENALLVGYSYKPLGGSEQYVLLYTCEASTTYQEVAVSFNQTDVPSTAKIFFRYLGKKNAPAQTYWYIDNVKVETDLHAPTSLAVTETTGGTATLSWTLNGNGSAEVGYATQSDFSDIQYATSNVLTGLNHNTTYYVKVRSRARKNASSPWYYSDWSDPISFTTPNYDFSAVAPSGQTLYYNIIDADNHYVEVICPQLSWSGFTKPTGTLALPETVTYNDETYTLTSIGYAAFYNCTGITTMTMPATVTNIGNYAFCQCSSLSGSLDLPEGLTNIGYEAFYPCKFTGTINIPASVTTIDNYAFYQCGHETLGMNVNIAGNPTEGTVIKGAAFRESKVKQLSLGEGVTSIGSYAFQNCSRLNTDLVIPSTVTAINGEAFYGCTALPSVSIEAGYIGSGAFYGCSALQTANLGDGITFIGSEAFYGCSLLHEVTIGEAVTHTGDRVFWDCPNLETVHFNATHCSPMYSIIVDGDNTYYRSIFNSGHAMSGYPAISTLTIGDNVTYIPDYAFYGILQSGPLTIPDAVTHIGKKAFYGWTYLTEVTIGEGVTRVRDEAFWKCPALTTVHFNATNCIYMETTYVIDSTHTEMRSVFNSGTTQSTKPAITTLTIGSNVTRFPDYAFRNANTITTALNIPASVTMIGDSAFYYCYGIPSLSFAESAQLDTIGKGAFYNCRFSGAINIPASVTLIGEKAFYWCGNTDGITVNIAGNTSEGTVIQDYAFYHTPVTSLTLGEGISTIGYSAFYHCEQLNTGLTIPNSVTSIGGNAFCSCTQLPSVTIGDGVTTLGQNAFSGCSALQELSLGMELITIGQYAFQNCANLQSPLVIPASVTTIGVGAFYGCSQIPSLTLPEGLTTIGLIAFRNCTAIDGTVTIPTTVTMVGDGAFYDCSGIDEIVSLRLEPATAGANTFTNVPADIPVLVSNGSMTDYMAATGWSHFTNYVQKIPDFSIGGIYYEITDDTEGHRTVKVTYPGTYQDPWGYHVKPVNDITIPDTVTMWGHDYAVTAIGDHAFSGCGDLLGVNMPATITSIGYQSFYGTAIGNSSFPLVIPEGVTEIGEQAFWDCPDLTTVYFNAVNCTKMHSTYSNGTYNYNASVFNSGVDQTTYPVIDYLVIGDNVTNIPDFAFTRAPIHNTLTIPASVTHIGTSAFYYCTGMHYVMFAEGSQLTDIGSSAFSYCTSLVSLDLPEGLVSIGVSAFHSCCSCIEVSIPSSVTSIGMLAFAYSGNEDEGMVVSIAGNPTEGTTIGNCAFGYSKCRQLTLGEGVSDISIKAFEQCRMLNTPVVIPNSVTSLGLGAFYYCNALPSVTIGNGVTYIGGEAFRYCTALAEVTIGEGVTAIDRKAFWDCPNLTTVHFNAIDCGSLKLSYTIGENNYTSGVFKAGHDNTTRSPITTLTIGENVTRIPEYAFYWSLLTDGVTIPASVTGIGSYAFGWCDEMPSLQFAEGSQLDTIASYAFYRNDALEGELNIPASVTSIGNVAFYKAGSAYNNLSLNIAGNETSGTTIGLYSFRESGINSVTLGEGVTTLENGAFYGCANLSGDLLIPASVTTIGVGAFYGCSQIPSLTLSEGLTTIGDMAFDICTAIDGTVTIPTTVTRIGFNAFYGCSGIDELVSMRETPATAYAGSFYGMDASIPVLVPIGSAADYMAATGWSYFTNYQEVETTVTQTIALSSGWNWISPNVDFTLDDLKAALVEALPGTNIQIKSKNTSVTYNGSRWRGTLNSLDVTRMYKIDISAACEIVLEGTALNPADHPVTIDHGVNWIAYPLHTEMSLTNAFNGFAVNGDMVKSKDISSSYNGIRWRGTLNTLVPGNGYVYKSAGSDDRIFTFPIDAK